MERSHDEPADLEFGTAQVCVSAEGGARYGFPHEKLKDGDKIDLGRVILTAKHTPGHTPEHMSYLAAESNHPDQPFAIFSGDCLFANSVGRPDLLGDDQTGGLAKQLYKSIYGFYLKLPDDVRVHPAHGAGSPCEGVRFAACENTLRDKSIPKENLLPGIATVPSGAVEVIRKQHEGYGYFKP